MQIISKRSFSLTPSSIHSAISCVQKESWNGLSGWLVKRSIVRLVNSSLGKSWRICILTSVNTSLLSLLWIRVLCSHSMVETCIVPYLHPRSTYHRTVQLQKYCQKKSKRKMTKLVSLVVIVDSIHWFNNRLDHWYASLHQASEAPGPERIPSLHV